MEPFPQPGTVLKRFDGDACTGVAVATALGPGPRQWFVLDLTEGGHYNSGAAVEDRTMWQSTDG